MNQEIELYTCLEFCKAQFRWLDCRFRLPGNCAKVSKEMCKGCQGNVLTCENKVNFLSVQLEVELGLRVWQYWKYFPIAIWQGGGRSAPNKVWFVKKATRNRRFVVVVFCVVVVRQNCHYVRMTCTGLLLILF